jgi:RNA polymerase sigma-70 factor (ECF subfamily)
VPTSPTPEHAEPGRGQVGGRALGSVQPISLAARRRRTPALPPDSPFEEVLTSAQAGFPSAFEHLFAGLVRPLAAYFRSQGASDPAGSTNEVFLRVFQGIGRFDGDEAGFRAWVFTIARHSLIDERRRSHRRVATASLEASHLEGVTTADSEQWALARMGDREAVAVIESLVPDQREVLLLRIVADLTIEQVAEVVGKRPGAVKALQRRGLATIRRRLATGSVPP